MLYRYNSYKVENKLAKIFEYGYFKLESITTTEPLIMNLTVSNGEEALFFTLQGNAEVNGLRLGTWDMYYMPPGFNAKLTISPNSVAYIARSWAEVTYKPYVKRYVDGKRIRTGVMPYSRTVIMMIGEDDPANSFIAGYVEGDAGNWTSYPPHRHDEKPETYIFYGLSPGFAVQLVISDEFEDAYVVHDYDVVLIPKGYHPNVPSTINSVNYAWVIAAPKGKRDLTVDYHPAFKNLPIGSQSHIRTR